MSGSDPIETIHHARRPSLPELRPDPEPPPSRRRTAIVLVAAVLASLCAGYLTTTMLADPEETAGTATAPRTATAPQVSRRPGGTLSRTQPAPGAAAGAVPPVTGDPGATTVPPVTPVAPAAPVADAGFDAPIPSGWREREFAVQKQGFLQSRWSDPRDPRTDVIINWSDGNRSRPAEAATALRSTVAGRTDYREVRFGPTRDKGWIWVYTLLDDRGRRIARIDLITRHCGVLFAVLGTTPAKRFVRLQRTFVAVSEGIRLKRRRC